MTWLFSFRALGLSKAIHQPMIRLKEVVQESDTTGIDFQ